MIAEEIKTPRSRNPRCNRREFGEWEEVDPIPVMCMVGDPAAVERAHARIPGHMWEGLDWAMSQIEGVREPGMYRVKLPEAVFLVDIMAERLARQKLTGPSECGGK